MIFITGGVRSGKSSYAEKRAIALQKEKGAELYYVATSRIYDKEMEKRVGRHQLQRERSGANWNVFEQKTNIDELLPLFKEGDVVLLDCVTTLVSNELFLFSRSNEPLWYEERFREKVESKFVHLFNEFAKADLEVVVVSNEVFFDLTTEDRDTESYKYLLGRVHQYIVSHANEAILVENGIPCWKKGEKR